MFRKTGFLLFVIIASSYAYFYQSVQHNEAARLDQTRAILENRQLFIDAFAWNTADVVVYEKGEDSHVYPAKAPGSSFLALIPMYFGEKIGNIFHLPEWALWHFVSYFCTLVAVSIPSALAAVAIYDVLNRMFGDEKKSKWTVIVVWLGTIIFPFSTLYFGHTQTAAMLVGSFWILFRLKHGGFSTFRRNLIMLFVAGFLAGSAVVNEYPAFIFAFILAIYFLFTLWNFDEKIPKKFLAIIAFSFGALFMAGLLMWYNYAVFGKIFYSAYQALGSEGSTFDALQKGFAGIHWPGLREFMSVLMKTLFLLQRGLFYINPILLLIIPGFILGFKDKKYKTEILIVLFMALAGISANALYGDSIIYWGGGASTGPRQAIPMLPFLALPLYFAIKSWRRLAIILGVLSVWLMLMAVSVEPRIPYEYGNPVAQFFIPHFFSGNLGLNRDALFDPVASGIFGKSTAGNLGGLIGLSGLLQIVPLLILWGFFGYRKQIFSVGAIFVVIWAFYPTYGLSEKLRAEYFENNFLYGQSVAISEVTEIDNNWRETTPFSTPFSVRWTGKFIAPENGHYNFFTKSDDGARVYIDGANIIDDWGPHWEKRSDGYIFLEKGEHSIKVEYHNSNGGGFMQLTWRTPSRPEMTLKYF